MPPPPPSPSSVPTLHAPYMRTCTCSPAPSPSPSTLTKVGAKHCAALDDRQLESLPTLQMGFAAHGGVGGLVIRPRHYMVEYPRLLKTRLRRVFTTRAAEQKQNASATRSFCVGIFDNQRGGTGTGDEP